MKTYENNMADQALTVKSLRVLENIDGGGIKEIRTTVDAVKKQVSMQNLQQEEFWAQLSDDGIITPIEKQELKREMANIERTKAAIISQAEEYGYSSVYLYSFNQTYEALYTYINTTLKLFDDMTESTPITDRETFNQYFSNFYWYANFINIAISAGILDQINFRVLSSLNEPGEEGETGIYKGGLYQYVDGAWKNVSTGAYKGARDELPATEEDSFFIVSDSFSMIEPLIINGEELFVKTSAGADAERLDLVRVFEKGYIYYCEDEIWKVEEDLTNWRYAAAFADVINITGRLPQIFQDAIDDLQAQVDTKASASSLQDEITARQGTDTIVAGCIVRIDNNDNEILNIVNRATAGTLTHFPEYYGGRNTDPANPKEGDFYVYTGATVPGGKTNSYVYRWSTSQNKWEELDPDTSDYRSYYMMGLEDILATNNVTSGFFSHIFCDAFFGNAASLNSLAIQTIKLRQGGAIQSDDVTYSPQSVGTKIDYKGNADFNEDVHIGGTCTIDGNTTIGGTCTISGTATIGGKTASNLETTSGAQSKVNAFSQTIIENDQIKTSKLNVGDIWAETMALGTLDAVDATIKNLTVDETCTIKGNLQGAGGTFNGKLNALEAMFTKGIKRNVLELNNKDLTELLSYITSYTSHGVYDVSGEIKITSSGHSWFSSRVDEMTVINLVVGNGFYAINGYTAKSGSVSGSGFLTDPRLTCDLHTGIVSGNITIYGTSFVDFLGSDKKSIIFENGNIYYYNGFNLNPVSYQKTGSITGVTKINALLIY